MEPEQEQEPIQKRLRKLNQNFMATVTLNDPDTLEMLEDMIATIEWMRHRPNIVREVRLSSTRVCRQHFLQWDPQVFMPGPIWQSVSFPPDRDITDSDGPGRHRVGLDRRACTEREPGLHRMGLDRAGTEREPSRHRAGTGPAPSGTRPSRHRAGTELAPSGTQPRRPVSREPSRAP